MKKAVVVCGHISSGKSSVINHLSKSYGWDIISFGAFVRQQAEGRNLPSSRQVYQDLGFQLFSGLGPRSFLEEVIEYHQPHSTIHLFDGVRHTAIVSELKKQYDKVFVSYLDVSDEVRYERHIMRLAPEDPVLSYSEFLAISQHHIEQGTSELATIADVEIDGSQPLLSVIAQVEKSLSGLGFL